jgi:hypothetical protein
LALLPRCGFFSAITAARPRKSIKNPAFRASHAFCRDTAAVPGEDRLALGWQVSWETIMRSHIIAAITIAALSAAFTAAAEARGGGHGFGRGVSAHGARFAGDRRHGNDSYIKAASDERDKLLTTKIKSICKGC